MPADVEGYVFPQVIADPFDFNGLQCSVRAALRDCTELRLYVTGLSVALAEVIRYCVSAAIPLTLCHYDVATGSYQEQPLLVADAVAAYDYGYKTVTGA
jgi:hypothetical protein